MKETIFVVEIEKSINLKFYQTQIIK